MYTGILHTHRLVVTLFFLIYLIKTILLLSGNAAKLDAFTKKVKVFEMIVSALFLLTGIFLSVQSGDLGAWFWYKMVAVLASIPLAIVGFKKKSKALAVVSLMLIVYAYGVSETRAPFFRHQPIVTSSSDPAVMGKEVFDATCANCHGADGKLGKSGAKDMTLSTLSHEEKVQRIVAGKNGMPPFRNVLTPEQVTAVADYVETLKSH